MSSSNCTNNYIPEYVAQNLPWYERDGLMTWYDQIKCQEFLRNSDKHFKTGKIVNFDIISREAAAEKVLDNVLKKWETIQNERVSKYPKNDQETFLNSAFRTERPDIFFLKKVVLDHFKKEWFKYLYIAYWVDLSKKISL